MIFCSPYYVFKVRKKLKLNYKCYGITRSGSRSAVTWIQIHRIRIRIRFKHFNFKWIRIRFRFGGFAGQNLEKNQPRIFYLFFAKKITCYLSLGFHKGRPSYNRSHQPSKKNIQHFKIWNLLQLLTRSPNKAQNDPQHWLQCCESGMFIRDPRSEIFPFRIRVKELKYFNLKNWFLSSWKYDPGCSSQIQIPDPDFLPVPDPGVKKAPDPGSGSTTLIIYKGRQYTWVMTTGGGWGCAACPCPLFSGARFGYIWFGGGCCKNNLRVL